MTYYFRELMMPYWKKGAMRKKYFGLVKPRQKMAETLRLVKIEATKGQIILKANFEVFIWTKNRTKTYLYFCST